MSADGRRLVVPLAGDGDPVEGRRRVHRPRSSRRRTRLVQARACRLPWSTGQRPRDSSQCADRTPAFAYPRYSREHTAVRGQRPFQYRHTQGHQIPGLERLTTIGLRRIWVEFTGGGSSSHWRPLQHWAIGGQGLSRPGTGREEHWHRHPCKVRHYPMVYSTSQPAQNMRDITTRHTRTSPCTPVSFAYGQPRGPHGADPVAPLASLRTDQA
jgi:hypothetical protein